MGSAARAQVQGRLLRRVALLQRKSRYEARSKEGAVFHDGRRAHRGARARRHGRPARVEEPGFRARMGRQSGHLQARLCAVGADTHLRLWPSLSLRLALRREGRPRVHGRAARPRLPDRARRQVLNYRALTRGARSAGSALMPGRRVPRVRRPPAVVWPLGPETASRRGSVPTTRDGRRLGLDRRRDIDSRSEAHRQTAGPTSKWPSLTPALPARHRLANKSASYFRRRFILRPIEMKFRPCIDLHGGVVKQIVGGTLNDAEAPTENFVSDLSAAHYASLYKRDGLIGGHVIMLGGGNDGPAREALAAHPGALHVGGGVTADNARAWLDAGASHVIVTSWIFQDGELSEQRLDAVVAAVGSDKLILDLSCRKRDGKYYVVTDRWQNFTSLEVCKETLDRLGEKCAEFLVHGVDVEGTRLGIDDELVVLLGATSPLPVTYAGGAASLEDLSRVEKLGGGKVDLTIGSALDIFGGAVPYADVVAWHDARQ